MNEKALQAAAKELREWSHAPEGSVDLDEGVRNIVEAYLAACPDLWREVPNGVDGHWHDFSKPYRCGIGMVVWRNAPMVRVGEEPDPRQWDEGDHVSPGVL